MNQRSRRVAAVTVVAVMLCLVFSYAAYPTEDTEPYDPVGSPWINSNLVGNLPAERPDTVDDFYTWANYYAIEDTQILPSGVGGVIYTLSNDSVQSFKDLMASGGEGEEWDALEKMWGMAQDTETREDLGAEPLMPYIEDVLSIETVEEYREYLSGPDALYLEAIRYSQYRTYGDTFGIMVSPSLLCQYTDPSVAQTVAGILKEMLVLTGMDAGTAETMTSEAMGADMEIFMPYATGQLTIYTLDEIAEDYAACGLADTMYAAGFPGDTEIMTTDGWLDVYCSMFTESGLESLKSLTVLRYLIFSSQALDEEFYGLYQEYMSIFGTATKEYGTEDQAVETVRSFLGYAVDGVFADNYVSDDLRDAVEDVFWEIKDVYRTMIEDCGWMSSETKTHALEKLDLMMVTVAEGDYGRGLHGLDPSEPENLLEMVVMGERNDTIIIAGSAGEAYDPESVMKGQMPIGNAYYYPSTNSVIIPAGLILQLDPSDRVGILSTIGDTIAHEISHAFDTNGKNYDAHGLPSNWWTAEDAAEYSERVGRLIGYLSAIEVLPGEYLNGSLVVPEAIADLCALQCLMILISEDPSVDAADLFIGLAGWWCVKYTEEAAEERLAEDPHPPAYVRVNAMVQQFQEFYDAFGVEEGDGMWLAPEDRILIW